jgi:hypothetical protein
MTKQLQIDFADDRLAALHCLLCCAVAAGAVGCSAAILVDCRSLARPAGCCYVIPLIPFPCAAAAAAVVTVEEVMCKVQHYVWLRQLPLSCHARVWPADVCGQWGLTGVSEHHKCVGADAVNACMLFGWQAQRARCNGASLYGTWLGTPLEAGMHTDCQVVFLVRTVVRLSSHVRCALIAVSSVSLVFLFCDCLGNWWGGCMLPKI